MDSGARSHMSFNSGNMISLTQCTSRSIMVGNGVVLPVSHIDYTYFPHCHNRLSLNNILVSNKIIKNVVSVRQITNDNFFSVTFDHFGFIVKDFKTGTFIQRCANVGNLYLILPSLPQSYTSTSCLAVSPPTWHRRFGHIGSSTLDFLHSRKFISCTTTKLPISHACQLGKHCHLLFSSSTTKTSSMFGLIHSDL